MKTIIFTEIDAPLNLEGKINQAFRLECNGRRYDEKAVVTEANPLEIAMQVGNSGKQAWVILPHGISGVTGESVAVVAGFAMSLANMSECEMYWRTKVKALKHKVHVVSEDGKFKAYVIAELFENSNRLKIQKELSENLTKLGFKPVISVLSAICKR